MVSGFDIIGSMLKLFKGKDANIQSKDAEEVTIVRWGNEHPKDDEATLKKSEEPLKKPASLDSFDTTVLPKEKNHLEANKGYLHLGYEDDECETVTPERRAAIQNVVKGVAIRFKLAGILILSKKGRVVASYIAEGKDINVSTSSLMEFFKKAEHTVKKARKKLMRATIVSAEEYAYFFVRSRELYALLVSGKQNIGSLLYIANKLSKDMWMPIDDEEDG